MTSERVQANPEKQSLTRSTTLDRTAVMQSKPQKIDADLMPVCDSTIRINSLQLIGSQHASNQYSIDTDFCRSGLDSAAPSISFYYLIYFNLTKCSPNGDCRFRQHSNCVSGREYCSRDPGFGQAMLTNWVVSVYTAVLSQPVVAYSFMITVYLAIDHKSTYGTEPHDSRQW